MRRASRDIMIHRNGIVGTTLHFCVVGIRAPAMAQPTCNEDLRLRNGPEGLLESKVCLLMGPVINTPSACLGEATKCMP